MKKVLSMVLCSWLTVSAVLAQTAAPTDLKILSTTAKSYNGTAVKINIVLNQKAQVQIEYGKDTKYGMLSTKEKSFKFRNHTQTILDLKPLTSYHYRAHAWDKAGHEVISSDKSFTTPQAKPAHKWASDWGYDYDKAIAKTKTLNKPIFALFSGSDWCPPCMRLEKNILNTKQFQEYLKENYVLLLLEFPKYRIISAKQQKHNRRLFKKYSLGGYPTILILDQKGEVIVQTGSAKNSAALIKKIEQLREKYLIKHQQ